MEKSELEEFQQTSQEKLLEPLQSVIDHAHWLNVVHRYESARHLEEVLRAARGIAYDLRGQMYRDLTKEKGGTE